MVEPLPRGTGKRKCIVAKTEEEQVLLVLSNRVLPYGLVHTLALAWKL